MSRVESSRWRHTHTGDPRHCPTLVHIIGAIRLVGSSLPCPSPPLCLTIDWPTVNSKLVTQSPNRPDQTKPQTSGNGNTQKQTYDESVRKKGEWTIQHVSVRVYVCRFDTSECVKCPFRSVRRRDIDSADTSCS